MDSEVQPEDLLYQTSINKSQMKNSINTIYVSKSNKINPLVLNKGSSFTQYSKKKKFTFEASKLEKQPSTNPNVIGLDENIHIPSQEFLDSEKSISPYSFGFSNQFFKKTMTEIKKKHELNNNFKPSKPLTPISRLQNSCLQNELDTLSFQDPLIQYKNICSQYNNNYIRYALTIKKIYAQYVSVSNSNTEITRSLSFKHQTYKNELNKEYFGRKMDLFGNKKTLVLDLDETMVFASTAQLPKFDFKFILGEKTNSEITIFVKLRPYLNEFLIQMSQIFEILVLTASEKEYADAILNFIEKKNKYFAHRLFKNHCIVKEEVYLFKNLNVLTANREMKDIIIVDNSVSNFALFICNGIPIIEFLGKESDIELCKLSNFLIKLSEENDCSEIIKENLVRFLLNKA